MGAVIYRPTTCKFSIVAANQTPGKHHCHFDFVICHKIDKAIKSFSKPTTRTVHTHSEILESC